MEQRRRRQCRIPTQTPRANLRPRPFANATNCSSAVWMFAPPPVCAFALIVVGITATKNAKATTKTCPEILMPN